MRRISSYEEAQRYLLGTIDEIVSRRTSYKLERMHAFLRHLGDPHRAYPSVHVGGTSGKGSTSTMIAAVLQACGKRTGLHTKPHLHSMTERAQIDGRPVAPERFADLLDAMMPAIERTAQGFGRPTYYETLLALAFLYFAQERVDVAVIEVGLGGRLDGTNVLAPVVTAITSVGYDHTEVLGTTLEAIAAEKAGIAKRGVPMVLGVLPAVAREVVERHAAEVGAPVVRVADAVRVEREQAAGHGAQRLVVRSARGTYALTLSALGTFQRLNAATALAALEQLRGDLYPALDGIARGFAEVTIPGRMEVLGRNPTVVFDIAHNVEKARSLVTSLREDFPGRRVHYVVAIGETKDARHIIETLAQPRSTFTFTTFAASGRRSIGPAQLARIAESLGRWGREIYDPAEALSVARRQAEVDDVVVVTGSTFVVAQLRDRYATAPA